jgi:hypothetical protein
MIVRLDIPVPVMIGMVTKVGEGQLVRELRPDLAAAGTYHQENRTVIAALLERERSDVQIFTRLSTPIRPSRNGSCATRREPDPARRARQPRCAGQPSYGR